MLLHLLDVDNLVLVFEDAVLQLHDELVFVFRVL